jgi:hypothetical protein
MFEAVKMMLMGWLYPQLVEENAKLRGELAFTQKELASVKIEVGQLEEDKHKLLDWVLSGIGMPALYSNDTPKPKEKPKNRFANVSQGRDYSRIATILENEGFSETEFQPRRSS